MGGGGGEVREYGVALQCDKSQINFNNVTSLQIAISPSVRGQSWIDLYQPGLTDFSKFVIVLLVCKSALRVFLASCCCSLVLHGVANMICKYDDVLLVTNTKVISFIGNKCDGVTFYW